MRHELTDAQDGRKALRIITEWSEVAADYDDLLAEYSELSLPGFRPGRAPRGVLEQRFRQKLRDDLAARCGRRLIQQALRDMNLKAAGPAELIEIALEPRRELSFTAEFVPLPTLDLPDYAAAPVAGATDEERRDHLSEWLLAHTVWEAPAALVRKECEREGRPGADSGSEIWREAARRVKLGVILEQIADVEGIETDRRDVDARIEKIAAVNGFRPEDLRRKLEREDGLHRLQVLLRAEQTLEYLLERAPGG
jgi:FKBP-type peptidyl-prolyl cis-trans isomerase (trigger factor)